ncbi:hypothetical protein IM792_09175 [Mucilaginibacter sp. JRF]|uniref:hypothetical protein n=1 Tax=Mucilaginibacter sp. JRF TaxID=2780088 RepID=UPI00187F5053|nr:hypothetical protein [Mucilaginibacter sp. JRF]MBE9584615.1 hypothetical protein [Mucilaginibacter sp. JRF]
MSDYLRMVLVYLKQELPSAISDILELDGWVFKFTVSDSDDFNERFKEIQNITEKYIRAIRERKADLNFTVWKPTQSRDFIVYK